MMLIILNNSTPCSCPVNAILIGIYKFLPLIPVNEINSLITSLNDSLSNEFDSLFLSKSANFNNKSLDSATKIAFLSKSLFFIKTKFTNSLI